MTQCFDDSILCLQDASDEDIEIAGRHNIRWVSQANAGIAESMRRIAMELSTDLVLFLENDCPLVETIEQVRSRLGIVKEAFAREQVDIFRLRHRWEVGEGFAMGKYLACHGIQQAHPDYQNRELLDSPIARPNQLQRWMRAYKADKLKGRAIYLETAPEKRFPEAIQRMDCREDEWFLTDSRYLNWTNQSSVVGREWYLQTLMSYVDAHPSSRTSNGFQSPERPLNCRWWRNQRFRIAVGTGLFTHQRVDGSWRPKHSAYESG